MSTPSKKRWNPEVTAKAIATYIGFFADIANPTDEEIAAANAVDNLAAIGESISGDGETYTATAVRTKLSSAKFDKDEYPDLAGEKVYQALTVKPTVGGGKKLQKITLIRALQSNMSDNDEEKENWASLEKANLDTIVMIVKKVCPDDIIQGILAENGIDRL